jgi:2',3'-cyclic-nucleotide 2'-phosphodiesterase (5'-nucleotidase family)
MGLARLLTTFQAGIGPAVVAVFLTATTAAFAEPAGGFSIVVLNDIDQMTSDGPRGGLDRVAAVVAAERAARDNVLVIHAGDALSPSIMSSIDRGAHMVDLLNRIGVDIFVPGNHEFDFGEDVFLERMAALATTKLAANLRDAEAQPLEGFQDHVILDISGVKVGILGVIGDRAPIVSTTGDLTFSPTIQSAFDEARFLRSEGAEFVVAVVHDNISRDLLLARSGAFDIVVSGDDHVLTVTYDGRSALVESREQGELIAIVDVSFDIGERNGTRRVSWEPSFRIVDTASVQPDAVISGPVQTYLAGLDDALDDPICTLEAELDSRRATMRSQEAAFGNIVADALRKAAGADVAIINGGSIRGDRVYPAGTPLTRRNLMTELPFANSLVLIEITGTDIVRALENGFSLAETGAGRFPQVAGMEIEVDLARRSGARVAAVTIAGEPLEPGRLYRLATNDFLARGGDGYAALRNAETIIDARDGDLIVNVVTDYLKASPRFAPRVDGRIKAL